MFTPDRNRKKVTLLDDRDTDQVSLGSIGPSTSQSSLQLNLPTSSRPRTTPLSTLLDEINSVSALSQITPTKTAPLVAVRVIHHELPYLINHSGDKHRARPCYGALLFHRPQLSCHLHHQDRKPKSSQFARPTTSRSTLKACYRSRRAMCSRRVRYL